MYRKLEKLFMVKKATATNKFDTLRPIITNVNKFLFSLVSARRSKYVRFTSVIRFMEEILHDFSNWKSE